MNQGMPSGMGGPPPMNTQSGPPNPMMSESRFTVFCDVSCCLSGAAPQGMNVPPPNFNMGTPAFLPQTPYIFPFSRTLLLCDSVTNLCNCLLLRSQHQMSGPPPGSLAQSPMPSVKLTITDAPKSAGMTAMQQAQGMHGVAGMGGFAMGQGHNTFTMPPSQSEWVRGMSLGLLG